MGRLQNLLERIGIVTVGLDETLIVFRMGVTGTDKVRGPGRYFLVPIIDRAIRVDRREHRGHISSVDVVDADGSNHSVDVNVGWQVIDPLLSVMNVANAAGAIEGLATTLTRNGAAGLPAAGFDTARMALADQVRGKLAEAAGRWGIVVKSLEITG